LLDRTKHTASGAKINVVSRTLLGDCGDLVEYQDTKPELLETVDGLSVMIPLREPIDDEPSHNIAQ
jgi:hypothetical protein